jgi:hypothetical protein
MARRNPTPDHEGYQGWKNYETWAVALWIDNDRGSHEYWQERADEIVEEFSGRENNDPTDVVFALADALKDHHEEAAFEEPDNGGLGFGDKGVFTDLLQAALSEVDWREVSVSVLGDRLTKYEKHVQKSKKGRKR